MCFCLAFSSQSEEKKKFKIAVIPKGTTHSFWKAVHAGALKAGKKFNVEIIWQGPLKEDNRAEQIKVVQNFTSRGINAIVLAPLDDRALVRPVKNATNRDIEVVIIDSGLKYDGYVSFVATDNYKAGKLCGKKMAELLNKKGKVLMLPYMAGSRSTMEREKGFIDGLKENAPKITILSEDQYAGATAERAFQTAQNLLTKYSYADGIFCSNESTTFGMLRAVQTRGLTGKKKFVGFDASEALVNGLKKGVIDALAVQNPFQMGYKGVKAAVDALNDKKVSRRIDTGVVIISKENINDEKIKKLLKTQLGK
jgi:ribose transport system substrate-binding protein